jgi:hypothetical protein
MNRNVFSSQVHSRHVSVSADMYSWGNVRLEGGGVCVCGDRESPG